MPLHVYKIQFGIQLVCELPCVALFVCVVSYLALQEKREREYHTAGVEVLTATFYYNRRASARAHGAGTENVI